MHPLSSIVGGLIEAGLSLDWLHEHAQVPWQMFQVPVKRDDGDRHWPDKQRLPLALSLQASRRQGALRQGEAPVGELLLPAQDTRRAVAFSAFIHGNHWQ